MLPASVCDAGGLGAAVAAALHFFAASQCLIQEPWPAQDTPSNGSRFEFIIVGGGSAGAALAARLANRAGLLLEAGGDAPLEAAVPGFRNALKRSPYDWNFTSVDDGYSSQGLAGGVQQLPRGRMLGGSGSLNDMVYSRGFPADYDEWAAVLGPDWAWDNVLPYFKKTEHMTDENITRDQELMRYHGLDGEIQVTGFNRTIYETERFIEAFQELGFDVVDDMTYPHKIGVGRYSHTIRDGRRDSSLTALLNKSRGKNVTVMKNALVTKVLFENNTAVGVKVLIENGNFIDEYYYYAVKEVILSAGAYNTPKLLMLSGVGPRDHLEPLGIEVVVDLPVGENLHDHVMYLLFIAADRGTCDVDEATQHFNIIQYLYDRSGLYSRSDSMGALYAMNGSEPNTPDFAFYPSCLPKQSDFYEGCLSVLGFTEETCARLHAENQNSELLSVAVVLLKPKSRGRVRLKSTDPLDDPLIYSGTFEDPTDLEGFPEAIEIVESLVKTKYFRSKNAHLVDIDVKGCEGLGSRDGVKCRVRALATSAWHAVGTAAMGRVVDARLALRGAARLRVADASVLPRVVRGNTNAPVLMIAEKGADFITQTYEAE